MDEIELVETVLERAAAKWDNYISTGKSLKDMPTYQQVARELLALRDSKGERVLFTRTEVEQAVKAEREKCEAEFALRYNPDYLEFRDGVEAGRTVERERIIKELDTCFKKDCPACTWKDGYFADSNGNVCSICTGTGKGEKVLFTKSGESDYSATATCLAIEKLLEAMK